MSTILSRLRFYLTFWSGRAFDPPYDWEINAVLADNDPTYGSMTVRDTPVSFKKKGITVVGNRAYGPKEKIDVSSGILSVNRARGSTKLLTICNLASNEKRYYIYAPRAGGVLRLIPRIRSRVEMYWEAISRFVSWTALIVLGFFVLTGFELPITALPLVTILAVLIRIGSATTWIPGVPDDAFDHS
jgi:hypothetical protein